MIASDFALGSLLILLSQPYVLLGQKGIASHHLLRCPSQRLDPFDSEAIKGWSALEYL